MLRSMVRIFFTLVLSLSLTLGVIAGFGTSPASAASQPTASAGYNPLDSIPTGVNYCYPSGYNRQGWRCGWRLAQAPYNIGDYNRYYGYYYGYYPYYGYGGQPPIVNGQVDYRGAPRYGYPYYPYYPYYQTRSCYNCICR